MEKKTVADLEILTSPVFVAVFPVVGAIDPFIIPNQVLAIARAAYATLVIKYVGNNEGNENYTINNVGTTLDAIEKELGSFPAMPMAARKSLIDQLVYQGILCQHDDDRITTGPKKMI